MVAISHHRFARIGASIVDFSPIVAVGREKTKEKRLFQLEEALDCSANCRAVSGAGTDR
jgi:hypothetical protein